MSWVNIFPSLHLPVCTKSLLYSKCPPESPTLYITINLQMSDGYKTNCRDPKITYLFMFLNVPVNVCIFRSMYNDDGTLFLKDPSKNLPWSKSRKQNLWCKVTPWWFRLATRVQNEMGASTPSFSVFLLIEGIVCNQGWRMVVQAWAHCSQAAGLLY